jgi:hypothetical protein
MPFTPPKRHPPDRRCSSDAFSPRSTKSAIDPLGEEPSTEERMDLILIILIVMLLFGGGFGYSRWGYGGGIGIGGILLIVLLVYLLVGHGRL